MNLLSTQTFVESPFIIVQIGEYKFGAYGKVKQSDKTGSTLSVMYPNYMKSLSINKINGAVNTYTLTMEYTITPGSDPNFLDKVFSKVSETRRITLSYGDWSSPSFIYKNESAIITKVSSRINFAGSNIQYVVTAVSDSLTLQSSLKSFTARKAKPSDVIKELLWSNNPPLTNIFTGMTDKEKVKLRNLIADDDKTVKLEARNNISTLDYLNYLVGCMQSTQENKSSYMLNIVDELDRDLNGPYFEVVKIESIPRYLKSYDTYEIDIGYPGNNYVTSFNVNDDQSWALLYNYTNDVTPENYVYKIDNDGRMTTEYAPSLEKSRMYYDKTSSARAWWNRMTSFPITATLTIKGLLRPSMLMTYVKINSYFYGQKHDSSGLYIITKQQDDINENGYRTTLTLLRVGEDVMLDNSTEYRHLTAMEKRLDV